MEKFSKRISWGKIMKENLVFKLKLTGFRQYMARVRLAVLLIKLAGWLAHANIKFEVEAPEGIRII